MELAKYITRQVLIERYDALFVFGDNMLGRGMGGQAKEMRGEPNAVGIPTKMAPGMANKDFFTDADFDRAKPKIDAAFNRLFAHADNGKTVVWPADGIGTGLAQLPTRAPKIWAYIEANRAELERR